MRVQSTADVFEPIVVTARKDETSAGTRPVAQIGHCIPQPQAAYDALIGIRKVASPFPKTLDVPGYLARSQRGNLPAVLCEVVICLPRHVLHQVNVYDVDLANQALQNRQR